MKALEYLNTEAPRLFVTTPQVIKMGPAVEAMEAKKAELVEVVKLTPKAPDFKYINELPEGAQQVFDTAVNVAVNYIGYFESEDLEFQMRKLFKYIGGGFFGSVFDLGHGLVLKINREGGQKDGEVMEALQGLPFIPKLYAYSVDGVFIVSQRVDGVTIYDLYDDHTNVPEKWDIKSFKEQLCEFEHKLDELGWIPRDCHSENCMVDREGNFYIVDVGCFEKSTTWNTNYLFNYAIEEVMDHGEEIQRASQHLLRKSMTTVKPQ